ncbi:MAG: cell division protein FtsX [Paracoccaceae bacterium]|nr:cell division protein FtsX [Paracoccaceae bacterium]MDG1737100.1 cell division protein FtsX [Paracoccaceae bacterium]MDG2258454.1 cell division protein FtsX [Paracoccaceae bacterium]
MSIVGDILSMFSRDNQSDRVVPKTGHTATLTLFTSAAMAFLTVFALALSMAAGRLADRWGEDLAKSVTVRISAPSDQIAAQTTATLKVLETTTGVASARVLSEDEQQALLAPWFGPDVPVSELPIPRLIEVLETDSGFDAAGLRLRLSVEAPGAVLDDHTRWREPLTIAAQRLRFLGMTSILLIAGATAAMITLAANAALAANLQVIRVLRLIGASDSYIARAFVRRFTIRAILGAFAGTFIGMLAILMLPQSTDDKIFLTGLGFQAGQWLTPLILPFLAGVVAFFATRAASNRALRKLS